MTACAKCGFQNEEGDAFCGSCGTFLEWASEAQAATAAPATASAAAAPASGATTAVADAPPVVPPSAEVRQTAQRAQEEADAAARAEEDARRQAEEAARAREEAEARARAEADARAKADAEAAARREAEERARAEAEERERREAAARAEAEEEARQQAEEAARARQEAEARAKAEEEEAARAAEAAARQAEADAKARAVAEAEARAAAAEQARREADERAKAEAEANARAAAEKKAREEAEVRAKAEAEERARYQEQAKATAEAEARARAEAEAKARDEADARAKAEADAKAKAEVEAARASEAAQRAAALVARPVAQPPAKAPKAKPPSTQPPTTVAHVEGETDDSLLPTAFETAPPAERRPEEVKPAAPKVVRTTVKAPPTRQIRPGDLICGECGEGNDAARKFCRRCGSSLVEAEVAVAPWWKRIFIRRRKVVAAGERPFRKGTATTGRRVRRGVFGTIGSTVRVLAAVAVVVGLLGYAFPWRKTVNDEVSSWFRSGKRSLGLTLAPRTPDGAHASTQLPGQTADMARDGIKQTHWSADVPLERKANPNIGLQGEGSWLYLHFKEPIDIGRIGFLIGDQDKPENYTQAPRPKEVHVIFSELPADVINTPAEFARIQSSNVTTKDIKLKDEAKAQFFDVKANHVNHVAIQIIATYGTVENPNKNVSIAEVEFRERT